jgi:hypothetical protein
MQIFAVHDTPNAGITVGHPPHQVTISSLEYADDAGLLDSNAQQASDRISKIAEGSRSDAAMEISIVKTKAMHVHKKVPVSDTTEDEICNLNLKYKCPNCHKDYPTKRGLAVHQGRWCDGGATTRSRKGQLADKAVQLAKRKTLESERDHVMLEDEQIENVYHFEYLGSRLQCDGEDKADVKHRMDIAQGVFCSLYNIWKDHRLPVLMKIHLYESAVCSTLAHSCEAWNFDEAIRRMINGFNSRCLHVITKKHYRETATNPDFDLVLSIRQRRLRYLGHIMRMPPDRLVRRTLKAYVDGGATRPEGSLFDDCVDLPFEDIADLARKKDEWESTVKNLQ